MPFARFLGAEERLKDARQMFRPDAGAGVTHAQTDEFTGAGFGMRPDIGFFDADFLRRDEQLAPVRHNITRIDHQVDQHLFQHADVGLDVWQSRVIGALQVDVFADNAGQHLVRFLITSFRSSGWDCMTCLRPKVSNWRVRLAARSEAATTCLEALASLITELASIQQHEFGVAPYDREEVVEVMRHTSSELADGFHFLRLPQL